MATFTIGFDLDMTLVDSRPGIKAVYDVLAAETGTYIDTELVVSRLGPPLDDELANWFPQDRVQEMAERYRDLYPDLAIAPCTALPGARETLAAVQRAGGRSLVVTAKNDKHAQLHLDALDLRADTVVGGLWASAKGEALREEGAHVYVGDHVGDILGGRAADVCTVAVATGMYGAGELRTAGADVVLDSLTAFPRWMDDYLARRCA